MIFLASLSSLFIERAIQTPHPILDNHNNHSAKHLEMHRILICFPIFLNPGTIPSSMLTPPLNPGTQGTCILQDLSTPLRGKHV